MKTEDFLSHPNIDLIIAFIMKKNFNEMRSFFPSSSNLNALSMFFDLNYSQFSIKEYEIDEEEKLLIYVKYLESGGCADNLRSAICIAFLNQNIHMVNKLISEDLVSIFEHYELPKDYNHKENSIKDEKLGFSFEKINSLKPSFNENSKEVIDLNQQELLFFIRYIYDVPKNFNPYINEYDRLSLFLLPKFKDIDFDFRDQEWYISASFIEIKSRCLYDKNLQFAGSAYFETSKLKSIQHKDLISSILSIIVLQNIPFLERHIDISLIQKQGVLS